MYQIIINKRVVETIEASSIDDAFRSFCEGLRVYGFGARANLRKGIDIQRI